MPFEAGEKSISELNDFTSSFEVYNACRSRDMCLRYMGEQPIKWADCNITPCPCSPQFYREVQTYAKVLQEEIIYGKLPYSRYQQVQWRTEQKKRTFPKKQRVIQVTQARLSV